MNKIISDLLKEAKIEKTLVLAHEFDEDRELSEDMMKRIEDAMGDVDVRSFVEDESFPYEYGSEKGIFQSPKKIVFEDSDQLLLDFKSNLPTKEVAKILNGIDWKKKVLGTEKEHKTSPDPVELKLKFTPKEKKILVEWTDAS
jgi:hypothetical protein